MILECQPFHSLTTLVTGGGTTDVPKGGSVEECQGKLVAESKRKKNKDSSSLRKSDPGDTQLQVWLTLLRIWLAIHTQNSTRQLCVLLCEQSEYTLRGKSMNG